MEEKDRILTPEERLLLIQEIINNGGLYAVNELLSKLSDNKNQISEPTVKEEPDTINKTDNSINSASIYASEALPLVKADLEEQKQRTREIEKQPMDETPVKPMVRERIPNPYSDSRTVIPENKEY